jgi:hypothetical protein
MEKIIFQIELFPKNLFFDDNKRAKSFLKIFFQNTNRMCSYAAKKLIF